MTILHGPLLPLRLFYKLKQNKSFMSGFCLSFCKVEHGCLVNPDLFRSSIGFS